MAMVASKRQHHVGVAGQQFALIPLAKADLADAIGQRVVEVVALR
jgi:hypothetical protein